MGARRRNWWILRLPVPLRFAILFAWGLEPISRGVDYITGDKPGITSSLSYVEDSAPLWFWGLCCLIGGLLVCFGLFFRWLWPLIAGSLLCGATYFTLSIGLIMVCIDRGGDGFRTPVMFLLFSFTWFVMGFGYWGKVRQQQLMTDWEDESDGATT